MAATATIAIIITAAAIAYTVDAGSPLGACGVVGFGVTIAEGVEVTIGVGVVIGVGVTT